MIGSTLLHYKIIKQLGRGGMGEVYLAEDTRLDRQVAIKVLPERLRASRGTARRAPTAKLNHPDIAHIYALEEAVPDPDDADGEQRPDRRGTARRAPTSSGGMDIDAFFATFLPLADALAHAHSQGRVHRDLKPGNIMIAQDGSGSVEPLVISPQNDFPTDWSRDGRYLLYFSNEKGSFDIWTAPLDGAQPVPLMETPHLETNPALSPDGRYVAYESNESGRDEVYIRPFPSGEGRWQVCVGTRPKWNGKGTELFFVSDDSLMVVDVSTRGVFRADIPKALFSDGQVRANNIAINYDVSSDGQRFVVVQNVGEEGTPTITVVENWAREFRHEARGTRHE